MTSRISHNNPSEEGFFDLTYHYELLSDQERIQPIKRSIQRICRDKRVLESGTGSGILSIFAAKAGAAKVYAVEKDPKMVAFARKNILDNGLEDRIELIEKDSRELTDADLGGRPVDVIIAENLSTWQVTEPQITILNHLHKFLHEQGVVLPNLASNFFELAESQFFFEDSISLRTHFFQFTGIKAPRMLSGKTLFLTLDFGKNNPIHFHKTVSVRVDRGGTLNSLRLTSPITFFEEIDFQSSDSLMPPVVVPLSNDLEVQSGDTVRIEIQYSSNTSWEDFTATAFLE